MKAWLWLLLAAPLAAEAAGGSWGSQSRGGTIAIGKQEVKSEPITPSGSLPAGLVGVRVAWRITPSHTPPPDLRIKLCSAQRCMALPALSGELAMPASFPVDGPFYFSYYAQARGPLFPVLTILRNQLTVNYRVAAGSR